MNEVDADHQHQAVRLPRVHGVVRVGGVDLGHILLLQAPVSGEGCRDGEDLCTQHVSCSAKPVMLESFYFPDLPIGHDCFKSHYQAIDRRHLALH